MKNILYVISLLTLFISACDFENFFEPIVEIELPTHKPKLVVMSDMWAGDDVLTVYVTKSRSALDTTAFPITLVDSVKGIRFQNGKFDTFYYSQLRELGDTVKNVTVELFKNDVLLATFKQVQAGKYVARLNTPLSKDGATYRIKVSAPNFETVEGVQKMPTAPTIDTIFYKMDVKVTNPNNPLDYINTSEYAIDFHDPIEENYYYTSAIKRSKLKSPVTKNDTIVSNELYLYSYDPLATNNYLEDRVFNGKKARWRQHGPPFFKGEEVVFYFCSISPEMYKYKQSIIKQKSLDGNPFAEPVISYSNIKNGYGIFSMANYTVYVLKK